MGSPRSDSVRPEMAIETEQFHPYYPSVDHQIVPPLAMEASASTPSAPPDINTRSDSIRSEKAIQSDRLPSFRRTASHQRIHPLDVEASTSAPSVLSNSFRSEKVEPVEHIAPPADRETTGEEDEPPRRRRWWCRCICWTSIIVLVLVFLLGITVGILFLVFQPKIPKYTVNNITVSDFKLYPNGTIFTSFNVTITGVNRNKKIGIYFDNGSQLSIWYSNNSLCDGPLPVFYQPPKNTTVVVVVLTGHTQYGSTLMKELSELQQAGRIPLDLKANVRVRVKFGRLKFRRRFRVQCSLVVNGLSADNLVGLRASSNCKF